MKRVHFVAKALAAISVLGLSGWLVIKLYVHYHRLSLVPSGLQVSRVLYAKELLWGIGPGGNETGVLVFELPEHSATAVHRGGVTFLLQACSESTWSKKKGGRFLEWKETPMGAETPGVALTPGTQAEPGYQGNPG